MNIGATHAKEASCLLMFSGGRDSTLAALRLHRRGVPLSLVTITSSHLVGIELVKRRLSELSKILPGDTRWFQVRQPNELRTDTSFYEETCLPCHHAYVVVSGALTAVTQARRLGFGYAGYQANWPEQTPFAVERLSAVLVRHGISLELPVYDLSSREAAIAELGASGLSTESLEQKCLRQMTNVTLANDHLLQQVTLWEQAIDRSMSELERINFEIIDQATLGAIDAGGH
jgi:hypothetical protein